AAPGGHRPAGGVRVVSRSQALRLRAPQRLRHRDRADGRLDLRARARAGDDSLPTVDQPAVPLMTLRIGCAEGAAAGRASGETGDYRKAAGTFPLPGNSPQGAARPARTGTPTASRPLP